MMSSSETKTISSSDSQSQVRLPSLDEDLISNISFSQKPRVILKRQCVGDFCDFLFRDTNRNNFQIRKTIRVDFLKQQSQHTSESQNKQPYEIPMKMILRVRRHPHDVVEILKKNRVFQFKSLLHYKDDIQIAECYDLSEFPILRLRSASSIRSNDIKQKLSHKLLSYDFVKICENCYNVYQLLKSHMKKVHEENILENKLKKQMTINLMNKISISNSNNSNKAQASPNQLNNSTEINLDHMQQISMNFYQKKYMNSLKKIQIEDPYQIRQTKETKHKRTTNSLQKISSQRLQLGLISLKLKNDPIKTQIQTCAASPSYMQINVLKICGVQHKRTIMKKKDTFLMINKEEKELERRKKIIDEKKITERQLRETLKYELQTFLQLKQGQSTYDRSYPLYTTFKQLRSIHSYASDSPMKSFIQPSYVQFSNISYAKLLRTTLNLNLPEELQDQVRIHVCDICTAIPFVVLSSEVKKHPRKNQIVLVLQDAFSSFTEFYKIFSQLILKCYNTKIILLNLPGQAFTLYDCKQQYDAYLFSDILDEVMFRVIKENLQSRNVLTFKQKLKFIGFGFGGMILQRYILNSTNVLNQICSLLLINSLMNIDNTVRKSLIKYNNTLNTAPSNLPELPFQFFQVLEDCRTLTDENIKQKMERNPIFKEGRQMITQALLRTHDILPSQIHKESFNIYYVRSFSNDFISDQWEHYLSSRKEIIKKDEQSSSSSGQEDSYSDQEPQGQNQYKDEIIQDESKVRKTKVQFAKPKKIRNFKYVQYVEGHHSFWESNKAQLNDILAAFLDDSWMKNV